MGNILSTTRDDPRVEPFLIEPFPVGPADPTPDLDTGSRTNSGRAHRRRGARLVTNSPAPISTHERAVALQRHLAAREEAERRPLSAPRPETFHDRRATAHIEHQVRARHRRATSEPGVWVIVNPSPCSDSDSDASEQSATVPSPGWVWVDRPIGASPTTSNTSKVPPALPWEVIGLIIAQSEDYDTLIAARCANRMLRQLVDMRMVGAELKIERSVDAAPQHAYIARLAEYPLWRGVPALAPCASRKAKRIIMSKVRRVEIARLWPSGALNLLLSHLPPAASVKLDHAEWRHGEPAHHVLPRVARVHVHFWALCACTTGERAGVRWAHARELIVTLQLEDHWTLAPDTCHMTCALGRGAYDALTVRLDGDEAAIKYGSTGAPLSGGLRWPRTPITVEMPADTFPRRREKARRFVADALAVDSRSVHVVGKAVVHLRWMQPSVGPSAL